MHNFQCEHLSSNKEFYIIIWVIMKSPLQQSFNIRIKGNGLLRKQEVESDMT